MIMLQVLFAIGLTAVMLGLARYYFGVFLWYPHSLRIQVEYRTFRNSIEPRHHSGNKWAYRLRQVREILYEEFGGWGTIGQGLIALLSVAVVSLAGYVVAMFANNGIKTIGIAPFNKDVLQALWQVQTTIVTLTFVIAVFLWNSLLDQNPHSEELRTAIRYTHSLFGIGFSLIATIVAGVVLMQNWSTGTTESNAAMAGLTVDGFIILSLAISTILLIFLIFRRSLGYLVYEEDFELNERVASLRMDRNILPSRNDYMREILEDRIGTSQPIAITAFRGSQMTVIYASDVGFDGTITDINIRELESLVDDIDSWGADVESVPTIGRSAVGDPAILSIKGNLGANRQQQIEERLQDVFLSRAANRLPWSV